VPFGLRLVRHRPVTQDVEFVCHRSPKTFKKSVYEVAFCDCAVCLFQPKRVAHRQDGHIPDGTQRRVMAEPFAALALIAFAEARLNGAQTF
jgi:hypothetical protein